LRNIGIEEELRICIEVGGESGGATGCHEEGRREEDSREDEGDGSEKTVKEDELS
jgi:hypothetical protein